MEIKKTPEADLEKDKGLFFLMSFVLILSISFVFLEWKQEAGPDYFNFEDEITFIEEEYEYKPPEPIEMPDNSVQPLSQPDIIYEGFREIDEIDSILPLQKIDVPSLQVEIIKPEEKLPEISFSLIQTPDEDIYTSVDSLPQFPGGLAALIHFIYNSIKYPEDARKNRIQGRVITSFIINTDGSVSDIKIEKGINILLDQETLRVLNTLPKWQPGILDNRPVRVKYVLPIWFRI